MNRDRHLLNIIIGDWFESVSSMVAIAGSNPAIVLFLNRLLSFLIFSSFKPFLNYPQSLFRLFCIK